MVFNVEQSPGQQQTPVAPRMPPPFVFGRAKRLPCRQLTGDFERPQQAVQRSLSSENIIDRTIVDDENYLALSVAAREQRRYGKPASPNVEGLRWFGGLFLLGSRSGSRGLLYGLAWSELSCREFPALGLFLYLRPGADADCRHRLSFPLLESEWSTRHHSGADVLANLTAMASIFGGSIRPPVMRVILSVLSVPLSSGAEVDLLAFTMITKSPEAAMGGVIGFVLVFGRMCRRW